MSNKLYEENDIQNIANAIRNKNGTEDTYKVSQMSTAIDSIEVIEQATAEGESLSLTNTKAMPYSDYVVKGKSEQETGKSKNYFDASKIQQSSIVVTDNGKTKELPIASSGNGNIDTNTFLKDLCPELNVGDVVYLNFTRNINPGKNNFIFLYNNTMSPPAVEWDNGTSKTIDQNLLDSYVILYGNRAQDGETQQIILTDFRIVKNATDEFEPYGEKPSPSNPSEIHSVADDVNLALITSTSSTIYNSILKNGEITINGTSTSATNVVVYLNDQTDLKLKENQSYIISIIFTGEISGDTYKAVYLKFGDTYVLAGSISSNSKITYTYTPNVETIFKLVNFDLGVNNTFNNMKVQIKVQKGTEVTPYSPYNQGTVTIKQSGTTENNDYTIQTEPLRSLPNGVKDTIEVDGIHRRVGKQIVSNGNFYDGDTWKGYIVVLPNKKYASDSSLMCNRAKFVPRAQIEDGAVYENQGNIMFVGNNQDTLETLKDKYDGSEVLYELAEEIIEPLTQNQATTMLDIIKTGSYEGTTNIYTDEDVKPTIGVGYYKKG